MLHHYPTRADLLAASIEHVFGRTLLEYQRTFEKLAETDDKAPAAIELLWETLSGPTYYAWLELVVAARTDPQLRRKLQEVDQRFDVQVKAVRERFFPPPAEPNPIYEIAPRFAFATLKGLSISNIYEEPERIRQVIEPLKQLAQLADNMSSSQ